MQRIVKFIIALLLVNALIAQTNTFPTNGNVGIGTTSPASLLDVKTNYNQYFGLTISPSGSHHSYLAIDRKTGYDGGMLWRKDGNFIWQNINSDNNTLQWYSYTGNAGGQQVLQLDKEGFLGLGSHQPMSRLHIGGSNQALRLDYNGTDNYYGSMRWSGLQLGNNGQNRIIAGRTSAGGWLDFYVNNTNEGVDYSQEPNGLLTMRMNANGNIGVGTLSPMHQLHINKGTKTNSLYLSAESTFGDRIGDGDNIYIRQPIRTNGGWWGVHMAIQGPLASHSAPFFPIRYMSDENSDGFEETLHFHIDKFGGGFFNGNVGIGIRNPTEKLSVNGNIRAKKLIVTQQNWSDYVFYKDYKLRSIEEVEKYIKQYQHLPEMPSAKEVQAKGVSLGDTQALLLKKIEELTLYVIELKKENIQQQQQINLLTKKHHKQ